jgi:hypothetical protein
MNDEYNELKLLQDKFRRSYKHSNFAGRGGIFRTSKRKQLLGLKGKSGRDTTKADFRYKVREQVKTALVDLELFIRTSDEKDVDMVLNRESLKPVIRSLLFPYSVQEPPKKGDEKVKIAQLLVEIGLDYLGKRTSILIPSITKRVENSIDLSKELSLMLLSEEGRKSINWSGRA